MKNYALNFLKNFLSKIGGGWIRTSVSLGLRDLQSLAIGRYATPPEWGNLMLAKGLEPSTP